MNVCINYYINDVDYRDVYFKQITRLIKNDKKGTFVLENEKGETFIFHDYLIHSVIIGVNRDYAEKVGKKWN